MEKNNMTNEELVEAIKVALPRSKTAATQILESIKYYENAVNTIGSFSTHDIGLRLFLDAVETNQSIETMQKMYERFMHIYERIVDLIFNHGGFIFKNFSVVVENSEGVARFVLKPAQHVPIAQQMARFPEVDARLAAHFESMLNEAYDLGSAINFAEYFWVALRNNQPLLINIPQTQVEMTINEIKRN